VCLATAEDWPIIERFAQLERHDLSEFRGYTPGPDGTYAFDTLDLFRTEPGRRAWLMRYGHTLAGFALTRPLESGGTSMYAFFVVRGLQTHPVAAQAARELLQLLPGVSGIGFQDANAGAQPFWERVATDAVATDGVTLGPTASTCPATSVPRTAFTGHERPAVHRPPGPVGRVDASGPNVNQHVVVPDLSLVDVPEPHDLG
jgi:predicted acetyltransferase